MDSKIFPSPVGDLLLEGDVRGVCAIHLLKQGEHVPNGVSNPVLEEAARQLEAYFSGKRTAFDLPLHMRGSAFEQAVWHELLAIPHGEARTYGQIAARLGKPTASRAVGGACSRNPLLIVVPCHRVVAGKGRITGFAAGMQAKRMLLAHEGWHIKNDAIRIK